MLDLENKDKITIDTEFDTWFGQTKKGEKCAITEVSMFEYLSALSYSEDEELAKIGGELFEKSKTDNYLELPDGARFGKTIKALLEAGMVELAQELTQDAESENIRNGHLDYKL